MGSIRHFRELDVYRMAMDAAMLSHPDQWTIRSIREEEVPYD